MKKNRTKGYLYAAIAVFAAVIGLTYYYLFASLSDSKSPQYIYIDGDDTLDSVVTKVRGVANGHGLAGFATLARHSGYADHVRTGRYAVAPGEGPFTVFRHMKNGVQSPVSLTIPEVRTMDRMAAALGKKLMLDSAEVALAFADPDFLAKYDCDSATLPALFIPNTYEIYWNTTLDHLMERMQKEHNAFWNADRKAQAEAAGLTQTEVATLASIVDEETANNAEKPMVAGMYLNRLKLRNAEYPEGMPLQADPTIKFAWKDFGLRRIYHKLLTIDSPYNTYKNTGLPPGPIKVASVKGIDAVLGYTHHDYLYMCAKEDFSGTHNFARTYEEHLKNAANYSKALNERGIK